MNKELEIIKHLIYTGNSQEHSVGGELGEITIDKCFDTIEKKLKAFDIIKKYISHTPNYYNSPADYSLESFSFHIKEDEVWLSGKEREQYTQDFKFLKEVIK